MPSHHCSNNTERTQGPRRHWFGRNGWIAVAVIMGGLGVGFWLTAENPTPAHASPEKNQLAGEASPYLQEAAHQPVQWLPWGPEAFRRAQQEDKPILLDIGAIWCHWCHVMDVESYEDDDIARMINQHFIAIKVDRDERPDIDRRYQQAVSALSGSGGWPLTAFLTPDGEVFHGGTYFPPEDRGGRPGLMTLLPKIAEVYATQKTAVVASATKLSAYLAKMAADSVQDGELSGQLVDAVAAQMVRKFDAVNGGFGTGVKFPSVGATELALARYFIDRDASMLQIVTTTLDAMARGGVYDHLGDGFFRYATDPQWTVPHFEKMSYDNAGLLINYLHAYQATGTQRYRDVAEGIMRYINGVLSDQAGGGFYASQDADMTREDDGDYYTWTVQEVNDALAKDEAEVILRYYAIQLQGEMRENPAKNVPLLAASPEAIAQELGLPLERVRSLLASGKKNLLQARMQRKTPLVDTSLYSDLNGMFISAYLEAFQALGDAPAKAFALRTLDRFIRDGYRPGQGMYHAISHGRARLPGLLNDQVQMANALLDAFQVTGSQRYLEIAEDLMTYAISHLWDAAAGGFFDRHPEGAALAALEQPVKNFTDNPTAAPNAVAALVLDRLAYLTNDDRYEQKALKTLQAFAGSAGRHGHFAATYALAVHNHLTRSVQAVIVGEQDNRLTRELWTAAMTTYRPLKMVAVYDPSDLTLDNLPPAVAGAVKVFGVQGKPQAYICAGSTCAPPTGNPEEVRALVKHYGITRS